jgi:hypothetical protein
MLRIYLVLSRCAFAGLLLASGFWHLAAGFWILASGIGRQVPIPGSRDRGSSKNNEIEDFWFFGTSGVRHPASGIKDPAIHSSLINNH